MSPAQSYPSSDISASSIVNHSIRNRISVFGMIGAMKTRPIREILADNVRRLMRNHVALDTQPKLAAKVGVSQSSINRLLSGNTDCLLETAIDIAKAFNVPLSELIEEPDAHPSAEIGYDRAAYAALPETEKAKVTSFVEFVISSHQRAVTNSAPVNVRTTVRPTAERGAAVQDAAKTRLSKDALSTNENRTHRSTRGPRRAEK